jgi:hypothetical protein
MRSRLLDEMRCVAEAAGPATAGKAALDREPVGAGCPRLGMRLLDAVARCAPEGEPARPGAARCGEAGAPAEKPSGGGMG